MPQLKRYLLFSVDTEPDDPTWSGLRNGPWSHENLEGIHELQSRMRILGVKPTYFITHSVAKLGVLEKSLDKDLSAKNCEVGTHFHPGDTPPFRQQDKESEIDNILKVSNEILSEKFSNLHHEISSRFGPPKSYRSGAWAMDARVTQLLIKNQYRVDSSVTPGVSWKVKGRPSYLGAPMRAYRMSDRDPATPEPAKGNYKEKILEIPVSIWSPRILEGTLVGKLFGDILTMPMEMRTSVIAKIVKKLRPEAPQWLRPAFKDAAQMVKVAMRLEEQGAEYLHVMCHSSELWPGTSPYVNSRAQMERFYSRLEGILRHALYRDYTPVTLAQFEENYLG